MRGALRRWKKDFVLKRTYSVPKREPFYALAARYLPDDAEAIVVDIGAADGVFAAYAKLPERFPHLELFDQNPGSIALLRERFGKGVAYTAPAPLPFKDGSVSFIHLSHIVEHLYYEDLLTFLRECDRVLISGGILIISTPLLWNRFYDDLSHVKPYNPEVFFHYLTRKKADASALPVSTDYVVRELVFRYRAVDDAGLSSVYFPIDALIRVIRIVMNKLGFRRYRRNGAIGFPGHGDR